MQKSPASKREYFRLKSLYEARILDSPSEKAYDDMVKLAAVVLDAPIALITFVDESREWSKARYGADQSQMPVQIPVQMPIQDSFCSHTIQQNGVFEVSDALADTRFSNNLLVVNAPHIRFYAGAPVLSSEGLAYGTLCIMSAEPRNLSAQQKEVLLTLSEQVASLIRLRLEMDRRDRAQMVNQVLAEVSERNHQMLTQLSEQVPGVIYQYRLMPDGRGCFPYSSHGIQKVYELRPDEVAEDGSKAMDRIHHEDIDRVTKTIADSAEHMAVWSCDYRVELPMAGLRWLHGQATPEQLSDGSILWHGFINDITEKVLAEERFAIAAKMSTLGELAAGIAHEINNPLAVILGKTHQIMKGVEANTLSPEVSMRHLKKIEEITMRISKIVKNLKNLSRATDDEAREEVMASMLVSESLEMCSGRFVSHGVELKRSEFEDFELECQSVQISQVLINLVNNAFDAVKTLENPWVAIDVKKVGDEAVIVVSDSGNGIPDHISQSIMKPFFTTKPVGEGTGLGLSIAQGIVTKHGGTLRYLSGARNTTFELRLPIKAGVPVATEPQAA